MRATVPSIELIGLEKTLGQKRVLKGLSLKVWPGEILVILGPSGTGKSVLLKHLVGLMRPDAGAVKVDGVEFWSLEERARNTLRKVFGMSFQEGALFDSMSVFDNVAFPLRRHSGKTEQEIRERVHVCLNLVRLSGLDEKRPSELSTGMRRRVGFARAIALEPRILLFDEPTAGLDNVMVTLMSNLIRHLTHSVEGTTVMVTHDLPSARRVADRVALLFGGVIVAEAPVQEFFELENPMVRQLVDGRTEGPLTPPNTVPS